jgi:hypothetical protein
VKLKSGSNLVANKVHKHPLYICRLPRSSGLPYCTTLLAQSSHPQIMLFRTSATTFALVSFLADVHARPLQGTTTSSTINDLVKVAVGSSTVGMKILPGPPAPMSREPNFNRNPPVTNFTMPAPVPTVPDALPSLPVTTTQPSTPVHTPGGGGGQKPMLRTELCSTEGTCVDVKVVASDCRTGTTPL